MASIPIPSVVEDLTPEWMTAALGQHGIHATATSVTPEAIGEAAGANGVTVRLKVAYAPGSEPGPTSMIIKLPATAPAVKQVAIRQQFYQNEIHFYNDFADRLLVNIPRRYYSGMDEEAELFALLLEDMAPAVTGNDFTGCTYDEAILVVSEIAKLHAPWWNSPELDTIPWLPKGEPNVDVAHARFNESVLPGLMNNYGHTFSSTVKAVCEAFCKNFTSVVDMISAAPYTLTHSDYRLVNLLIGGDPASQTITVVDWQRVAKAKGLVDIAFFTVLSLPPERRREWESSLVETYHAQLVGLGVADYTLEQCRHDYRLCAFAPTRITLSFGARPEADLGGVHGKRLQSTLVERVSAAIEDMNLAEFL
ncbi:MAG: DUF1679 domain-containing protein [Chloroflexi bacterium]|nr:DUF1679 domain-containing protein [Chloroflexota bacterium]